MNAAALDVAGFEALLPSRGYLDHLLLDAHGLYITLKEKDRHPRQFQVTSAEIRPFSFLLRASSLMGLHDELEQQVENLRKTRDDLAEETDTCKRRVGAVYSVIRCGHIMHTRASGVTQKRAEQWAKRDHAVDWESWLTKSAIGRKGHGIWLKSQPATAGSDVV